jgi:flagellar biosynthesis/type III secretory pathway protein FliH
MSDVSRKIALSQVADLVQRGGDFIEEDRYAPDSEAPFVPWGKSSFKPAPVEEELPAAAEAAPVEVTIEGEAPAGDAAPQAPAPAAAQPAAAAPAAPQIHIPTPAPPTAPAPSAEEIVTAIEKAREDGRSLGYQQGIDAARRELGEALVTLRNIEREMSLLSEDAVQRNADIMAHHVRRIAQDLFGAVFAEMPDVFVERIKTAAEMFTKAGGEFTLALSPHDMMSLSAIIAANGGIFEKIQLVEDDKLASGSFRLFSRDLDYEDTPQLHDARG